jgi:hypothetical protein
MTLRGFTLCAVLACLGCGSSPEEGADGAPEAPPIARDQARAGSDAAPPAPDPRSPSRVLGHVEGEVITYRDVQQRIGPELAQLENPEDRLRMEDRAVLEIVREKLLYRAAVDWAVRASRDEIEEERKEFVKELARNGGTLDAFLHEHDMTRREFDEMIRTQIIVRKYRLAAIGHSADRNVRVRPVTDTYVPPDDVRKYYDRHPERFQEPASARFRMLTVKSDLDAPDREKAVAEARRTAEAALLRLRGGEDWVPVYRGVSKEPPDPQRPDGLERIPRGKASDWIEEFAFESPKGTLSDVIQKGTTFYVLRAEGALEARTVPFEEAAAGIRTALSDLRRRLAWLEVELSVLDESSVQPDSLRARLRDNLRQARVKMLTDAGL